MNGYQQVARHACPGVEAHEVCQRAARQVELVRQPVRRSADKGRALRLREHRNVNTSEVNGLLRRSMLLPPARFVTREAQTQRVVVRREFTNGALDQRRVQG